MGTTYGLAARADLHGKRAVAVVFVAVYTAGVMLNTALDPYQPSTWSRRDWAVDIGESSFEPQQRVFDRLLDRPAELRKQQPRTVGAHLRCPRNLLNALAELEPPYPVP